MGTGEETTEGREGKVRRGRVKGGTGRRRTPVISSHLGPSHP